MTTPAPIHGIDLSNWQAGSYNFAAAKRSGVGFMFHKASEGMTFRDAHYSGRRVEAATAGIKFGAYHFAHVNASGGKGQAQFFLGVATPKAGDIRPALDFEDPVAETWTAAQRTDWVGNFVNTIKAETGAPPFIYIRHGFDLEQTFDCPLWVPAYSDNMTPPSIPAPWRSWTVWQFSDGTYGIPKQVPGIGACDINTLNGNPAKLLPIFTLGAKPAPKPAPKPTPAPAPKPTTPTAPTRVSTGRAKILDGLTDLDAAVKNGRTGTVRIVAAGIRALVNRLPLN